MFGNKRFACAVLGFWLGVGACADIVSELNYISVNRFLADPGSPAAAAQMRQAGAANLPFLMRRSAAEENGWMFGMWEWAQIGLSIAFLFLVIFGERPPKSALVLIPAMLVILLLQCLNLTPHILSIGRDVDEMPARALLNNPIVIQYGVFRKVFWGTEILKFLLGLGLASRLMIRRDTTRSSRERDTERGVAYARAGAAGPDNPQRLRRRKSDRNPSVRDLNG